MCDTPYSVGEMPQSTALALLFSRKRIRSTFSVTLAIGMNRSNTARKAQSTRVVSAGVTRSKISVRFPLLVFPVCSVDIDPDLRL